MRQIRYAFATAICLAFGPAAMAQDVQALAEEYVHMPEVQQMMTEMFSPASMAAQFKTGLPPGTVLTDSQMERIGALMSETMTQFRPRMEELMIASSAKHFTAEELQALIDFYKSEHGAAVMAKMQPYMQDFMGQMMPDIMTAMQAIQGDIMTIMSTP
ncbi:DUF2059 domain-containing protein [Tabrizicola sp.]|uniref:DUF2059 domain-containing protein n=1 Tax=Tabrizicola sp. TaxID=2005166 RepID=UPI002FDE0304